MSLKITHCSCVRRTCLHSHHERYRLEIFWYIDLCCDTETGRHDTLCSHTASIC